MNVEFISITVYQYGGIMLLILGITVSILVVIFLLAFYFSKKEFALKEIKNALERKEYEKVIKLGKEYIKKNDVDFSIYYYMGQAYQAVGKSRSAIECYEKAAVELNKYTKSALKNQVLTSLGKLYMEIGKKEEAMGYFKMVLSEFPNNPEALWGLGKIYFDAKNFLKARDYLEKFLLVNPKNIETYRLLAETYYNLENYQKALSMLNTWFEKSGTLNSVSDYNRSLIFLADIYTGLKRYNEAIATLKPLLDDESIISKVLPKIIQLYLKTGETEKAIQIGDDYLLRIPMNERPPVLYELGNAYANEGEFYKAIELWESIIKIQSNFRDVRAILEKYKVLTDNPHLENIFTKDDSKTKEFILRKFNIKEYQIYYKSSLFWVVKDENLCYIIYKKPFPVVVSDLNSIENFLRDEGLSTYSVTLYTLFGVDKSCYSNNFYRKLNVISGEAFLLFFKKE